MHYFYMVQIKWRHSYRTDFIFFMPKLRLYCLNSSQWFKNLEPPCSLYFAEFLLRLFLLRLFLLRQKLSISKASTYSWGTSSYLVQGETKYNV